MSVMMYFLFLIHIFSFQAFAFNHQVLQNKSFGNYQVNVKWDNALDGERIVITKNRKIVYTDGEPGNHYWIGNHYFHWRK